MTFTTVRQESPEEIARRITAGQMTKGEIITLLRVADAAHKLVEAVDKAHDSKRPPYCYTVPWAAVTELRKALAATSGSGEPKCAACKDTGVIPTADGVGQHCTCAASAFGKST